MLVFLEFDFAVLLLLFWGVGVLISADMARRSARRSSAKVRLATHFLVLILTTAVAAAAPGKRIDQVLDRPVSLEQSEFSIAELAAYCQDRSRYSGTSRFPLKVFVSYRDEHGAHRVRFPDREMTLRDFVDAIESQSTLRHSFGGCGNAYGVARGPAYNFGLSFRDRHWD